MNEGQYKDLACKNLEIPLRLSLSQSLWCDKLCDAFFLADRRGSRKTQALPCKSIWVPGPGCMMAHSPRAWMGPL